MTGRERPKNSAHDLGLISIDLAETADRFAAFVELFDHAIAIGEATGRVAIQNTSTLAAPDLGGKIPQEQGVHGPLEAHVQFVDRTLGESDDLDTCKAQSLEETGHVFLIA